MRRAACRGMALLVLYLTEEEEEDNEAKFDQVWQLVTSLMKVIKPDKLKCFYVSKKGYFMATFIKDPNPALVCEVQSTLLPAMAAWAAGGGRRGEKLGSVVAEERYFQNISCRCLILFQRNVTVVT